MDNVACKNLDLVRVLGSQRFERGLRTCEEDDVDRGRGQAEEECGDGMANACAIRPAASTYENQR